MMSSATSMTTLNYWKEIEMAELNRVRSAEERR